MIRVEHGLTISLPYPIHRYYDVRTLAPLQTWKLQFPTGGTIRYLASAENWIAVGNHNGHINTLDVRTGELLSSWKPSDFYPNPVSGIINWTAFTGTH